MSSTPVGRRQAPSQTLSRQLTRRLAGSEKSLLRATIATCDAGYRHPMWCWPAPVGSMDLQAHEGGHVLDPYTDYKLYRQEMDRLEKQLELRRQLPVRERRHLPHVSLSFVRQRRRQRLAEPSGC